VSKILYKYVFVKSERLWKRYMGRGKEESAKPRRGWKKERPKRLYRYMIKDGRKRKEREEGRGRDTPPGGS
jgi:hypothetical protein